MKISSNNFQLAEFGRNVIRVEVETGTKVEDLLEPNCWSNVANRLHRGDKVEVVTQDLSLYAEFIVQVAARTYARLALLKSYNLDKRGSEAPVDQEFYVRWSSPHTKFRIHRTLDKSVIRDGFESADEARAWLAENLPALKSVA